MPGNASFLASSLFTGSCIHKPTRNPISLQLPVTSSLHTVHNILFITYCPLHTVHYILSISLRFRNRCSRSALSEWRIFVPLQDTASALFPNTKNTSNIICASLCPAPERTRSDSGASSKIHIMLSGISPDITPKPKIPIKRRMPGNLSPLAIIMKKLFSNCGLLIMSALYLLLMNTVYP